MQRADGSDAHPLGCVHRRRQNNEESVVLVVSFVLKKKYLSEWEFVRVSTSEDRRQVTKNVEEIISSKTSATGRLLRREIEPTGTEYRITISTGSHALSLESAKKCQYSNTHVPEPHTPHKPRSHSQHAKTNKKRANTTASWILHSFCPYE